MEHGVKSIEQRAWSMELKAHQQIRRSDLVFWFLWFF